MSEIYEKKFTPDTKNSLEGIEKEIESLSNESLTYQLILVFKKNFKNIEVDEPTINKILNYFMFFNQKDNEKDYTEFEDALIEVGWRRDREFTHTDNFIETVDIYNKKFLLLILLHKLMNSLTKIIDTNPKALEYLSSLNIIYRLYLSSSDLSIGDIEKLNKLYKVEELYLIADGLLDGKIK